VGAAEGGHKNILKRHLIHVGALNLSLILRSLLGAGTPREWENRGSILLLFFVCCSPAGIRMGSSLANRQSFGQNTSRQHEVEYAAGAVASEANAPQAANLTAREISTVPCTAL
jgi:hypothetical protein